MRNGLTHLTTAPDEELHDSMTSLQLKLPEESSDSQEIVCLTVENLLPLHTTHSNNFNVF